VPKFKGYTAQVREAAKKLGTFSIKDLIYAEHDIYISPKQVRNVVSDMRKSGEIVRFGEGAYRYVPKERNRTKIDVIWHLVRSHRQFDTNEIERFSKAARYTVLEYLHCLRRLGYIRQVRWGHWQLINDPGPETPVNTAKCKKLRTLRKVKREAS